MGKSFVLNSGNRSRTLAHHCAFVGTSAGSLTSEQLRQTATSFGAYQYQVGRKQKQQCSLTRPGALSGSGVSLIAIIEIYIRRTGAKEASSTSFPLRITRSKSGPSMKGGSGSWAERCRRAPEAIRATFSMRT